MRDNQLLVTQVRNVVAKSIKDTLQNFVCSDINTYRDRIQCVLQAKLQNLINMNVLTNYAINDVTCCNGVFSEHESVAQGTLPGDAYGETGIVVSTDGHGRALVFDPNATTNTIKARVSVQPTRLVDYIVIDVSV